MTWYDFFPCPSTPAQKRAVAGAGMFLFGSVFSYLLASYILSECEEIVDHAISQAEDRLSTETSLSLITFKYGNITIEIPTEVWLGMLKFAESQEKRVCFNIPLLLELSGALWAALCFASPIVSIIKSNDDIVRNDSYLSLNP